MNENHIIEDLNLAIAVNSVDIVYELLSDESLNLDAVDARGHTALVVACAYGRKDIVKILVDHKADVNQLLPSTRTVPLHIAASNGFADICRILVENGAAVQIRDHNGSTPIEYAEMSPQPSPGNGATLDRCESADSKLVQMRQECLKVLSGA